MNIYKYINYKPYDSVQNNHIHESQIAANYYLCYIKRDNSQNL